MKAETTSHLQSLDVIRGVAIIMVFFHHVMFWSHGSAKISWDGWHRDITQCLDWWPFLPITVGYFGVAVFFVVSGFCIHLSYAKSVHQAGTATPTGMPSQQAPIKAFFIKRFWRIYPPYLLTVLMFLAGDVLIGQIDGSSEALWQGITHVLLIHNFFETTHYGINPSFWSISIEAQLYLIYPALFFIALRCGWGKALGIAFVSEVTLRILGIMGAYPSGDGSRLLSFGPFYFWFSWAIGAWLAERYMAGHDFGILSSKWFTFISILFVILTWFIRPCERFQFTAVATATASILAHAITPKNRIGGRSLIRRQSLGIRILAFFGTISYSLYLIHQPIISVANKLLLKIAGKLEATSAFLILGLSLVPIGICAWLFYRFVEVPSMRQAKKFLSA
jgi:peptidoglycan/LPS O-acetylase OafA/YrhL